MLFRSRLSRRIAKIENVRRAAQNGSHYLALNADASSVDDTKRRQTQALRFLQVRFYRISNIASSKRVQIQDVRDRYRYWFVVLLHD